MKLASARAGAAFERPDPAIRLFLLSGPDQSSNRLLAQKLTTALGAAKLNVTTAQLKSEPNWLADEAAAISMFGDRKLLWVEPAGEDILPAVQAMLALPQVEAATVAIMSPTAKRNGELAKFSDKHPAVLHVESSFLSLREQVGVVMEMATAEGLRVAAPLAERIASEADGDMLMARLELQKFALYLDASSAAPKDLDEETVAALGIDQAEAELGRAGDLALSGEVARLADELILLDSGGIEPIPVMRALQRRLISLSALRRRIDQGERSDAVMRGVWTKERPAVERMLSRWTGPRLADAFMHVQKLERELLLQPVPGRAALGETLLQLARAAAARR
ncbi:DNA polymerase III subunit delta [Sphingomonas swuensis]|uniref:DNA-directed DNA polymerase n=1 Tax=Sphingomonas swuensis TaxID=977800 RepID=A0ABP7S8M6_9SPHN